MRHLNVKTTLLLPALLLAAPCAFAQGPVIPSITDARAYVTGGPTPSPNTPAITAGVTSVGITVTGSNFDPEMVTGDPHSEVYWVPSSGNCPIATCVLTTFAPTTTTLTAQVPNALVAAADTGATIYVRNPDGSASAAFPMPVNPRPTAVTPRRAFLNVPYAAFVTTGGTAPYSLADAIPTLAPGMNLQGHATGGGMVVGAPTLAGVFASTATIQDAWDVQTAPNAYNLEVGQLPAAAIGYPYLAESAFEGVTAPVITIISGSLPNGITASVANGILSLQGTPTTAGTYTAGLYINDATAGVSALGSARIVVAPPVSILTSLLPPMPATGAYAAPLMATGGVAPYLWYVASGSLPQGLTLNPETGVITGTPTGPGRTFTIQAIDSVGLIGLRTYTLNYELRFVTSQLPAATTEVLYREYIQLAGGSGSFAVTLTDGSFPPGIVYQNGELYGRPTQAGTFTFTMQAVDAADPAQAPVSQQFTLVVNPGKLTIITGSPLPDTEAGPISIALAASGGAPPYTWAITAGAPPAGAALSSAGVLSGTTTATGSYAFTVTVTDSQRTTSSKRFTLNIVPPQLKITTTALTGGAVAENYSAALEATGGAPPYTWSVTGLPAGLTAAANGTITGAPAASGNFTLGLSVTDSQGTTRTGTATLAVVVRTLTVVTTALPNATAGTAYTGSLQARGGVPPYRWSLTQAAPAGFTLAENGIISGTPPAAGALTFAVQVKDSAGGAASGSVSLQVNAGPLTITTGSLPAGTAGTPYSQPLAASGGAPPYTWSGSLPAGLAINASTGVLSGASTVGGATTASITVTDSRGAAATRTYSVQFAMPSLSSIDLSGIPSSANPLAQPGVSFVIGAAYPLPINGTVTLTFQPDSGADDPNIVFSTGGRTTTFTIPAGSTAASFTVPNLAFQSGTVAGVVTLTLTLQSGGQDITPSPAPTRQIRIAPSAPGISSITATRSASGFTVTVTGYSATRSVTQAIFRLTAVAGSTVDAADITVPVTSLFASYYQTPGSAAFGSQFLFTQNFTVSGDVNGIASVSVTLVNAQGSSQTVTAQLR